ncbi:MAG: M1 family aminopeptidase [Caulobacter sp.]|nr:M1 family aminopeptidase [Caulobacter sp.]
MFGKVAGFEFRYQIRQPVFWISTGIFFLLTFLSVAVDAITVGGDGGGMHRNAPYQVVQTQLIFAIFFMFVTTAFVANVIVRDDETGFGPLLRSTRITKFAYLYGRFTGAFGAAMLAFLTVPGALALGAAMPWLDRETLGPLIPQAYLFGYLVMALPVVFLTSALFFALATITRSMMWTYVGVVGLLVVWVVATIALDRPEYEKAAALWEPFGAAAFGVATKFWTVSERNSLVPALEGALLWNRVIFTSLGFAVLALAYPLFGFQSAAQSGKRARTQKLAAAAAPEAPPPPLAALPRPTFGRATAWAQLMVRTRLDMAQVFGSPAYVVLLAIGLFNSMGALWFATDASRFGGVIYPVTRALIMPLLGSFSIIPVIIAIYYAGELVWRERERKTHEIVDCTPVPDWAFVAPKILAIALVLISTVIVSVIAAVLVQTLKGYFDFRFDRYLLWYVLPISVNLTLTAVLAVFLQAVAPHKFIGWGLMMLVVVAGMTLPDAGFDHALYIFGGGFLGPIVPLSDMNGLGRFWIGAWWIRLYWSAFCLILAVLAYALWRRGTESRLTPRLARLPSRLTGKAGMTAAVGLALFVGSGGWIYYNTNVLNEYRTEKSDERWLADYEKTLGSLKDLPRPSIVSMDLDVRFWPREPRAVTKGRYLIENRTGETLRELHLAFDRDVRIVSVSVEGRLVRNEERFNYRVYALDTPLLNGARRVFTFETERRQLGFRNRGDERRVVANGAFLNNTEIAPFLGVEAGGFLQDRAVRRKLKLTPIDIRPPSLDDVGARRFNAFRRDADYTTANISVETDDDQLAIAPGRMVGELVSGGRRKVRFVAESPGLPFYSVQSGRYAVSSQRYKGVDLAVYYHPEHPWNVERMETAAKVSLDYMQAEFSPYQFTQLRFLEFPAYANFAQSFANTVPWSENLFFIANYADPEKVDMVTYVGAHEIGHQWWAHQLIGANQQGAAMLSETFAQYSALMVMKRIHGEDQIRRFLKFELDRYLRERGSDVVDEQPLMRVEDQPYIYYNKGGLVMYRLQHEIGEATVNRALRRLLARFAFKTAPYASTRDFVDILNEEAPDRKALISDLFEKITLYDIRTTGMTVKKRADGRFDVTLKVTARKMYADGKGVETEAPLAETLDVGLFTAMPGKKGFDRGNILLFERRPIRSGTQTLTFVVDKAPRYGGVDPYNFLIDRNSDDNVSQVG